MLEVGRELARGLGKQIEPEIVSKFRAGDIRHCFADITLARKLLGYEPQVRFAEGMRELLGWVATQQATDSVDSAPRSSRPPASPGERRSRHHDLPGQHQQPGAAAGLPGHPARRRSRVTLQTIVIDNASTDGSAEAVRGASPTSRWWPAIAVTASARTTTRRSAAPQGRYVFILNEDTELHEGCLDGSVRFLDQNPEVGAAGPRILYPDGSDQPSAFHFPSPARVALTTLTLQRALWVQSAANRSGGWTGCAARRSSPGAIALEAIGGFDEALFIYSEDPDLCLRLREAGYATAYFPYASLVHSRTRPPAACPSGGSTRWSAAAPSTRASTTAPPASTRCGG